MACAALAPALLVGVASYITVEGIQAEEVAQRLGERAATAERQLGRFIETRRIGTRVIAGSRALSESLEQPAPEPTRDRLDRLLAGIQRHDPVWEGLAVFDLDGALVSAIPSSGLWSPEEVARRAAGAPGPIDGAGPTALLFARQEIRGAGDRPLGRLVTASRLEPLWRALAAEHESPVRLRIVDARRRTLFDSDFHPEAPTAALPAAASDQLFELRVGNASYADEAAGDVVAAHRFEPTHGLGALVEMPAAEAASDSRRWRQFALRGSLATVGLLGILFSVLALHVTGPLGELVREVQWAASGDTSKRLAVTSGGDVGRLTVAINQLLDAQEKSRFQLERLSSSDQLTGLHNRRHLDRMFEVELNRANRSHNPLSVLMIDLDRFTAYNERFGRPQGDVFLQHVASFLKTWLRTTDVVARYGGEEFTVLLPDTDREAALEIAERLRVRFADSQPPTAATRGSVTLSIGVATWSAEAAIQTDLLEAADRAVREAKKSGRNQVRFAA